MHLFFTLLYFVLYYFLSLCSYAQAKDSYTHTSSEIITKGRVTNLPIPRFVTLKNSKTYMRSGPGKDYGLLWVYQKKGLPIEVLDEYEQWRRVKDLDGSEGWIHQSVLSGRRMLITLEGIHNVYENADSDSDIVAKVESEIILPIEKCTTYYCYVVHDKFSGWLKKSVLYGVYDTEKLTN